jgi:2-methylisocitrate lyase-like PEP mutase family enzyme
MKEELHYGYKKVIYPNGTIKYYNIAVESKYYKEITEKQALRLEAKVMSKLKFIRYKNLQDYNSKNNE